MSPSPIIGGVLGGLLTGGFFGWIAHGRSIRPVLVFLRDPDAPSPRWQIQNVGAGPALNLRIRDYRNAKEVAHRIHAYALMPGEPRSPYAQNFTTPTYARQGRGPDTQGWGGLLSVLASRQRNELEVSLSRIVERKSPDLVLSDHDIFYIPDNGALVINSAHPLRFRSSDTIPWFG
jgi:hypothetical protein